MKTQDQKQALENSLRHFNLKSVKIYQHIVQDKRKTKAKFFLQIGQNTISPTLEYNEMNHFILGMSRAKQLLTNT